MNGKKYLIYNGNNKNIYSHAVLSNMEDDLWLISSAFKEVSYLEYINYRLKHRINKLRNWWSQ